MKSKILLFLVLFFISAQAQQTTSDSAFASLHWLAGYWTSVEEDIIIEEIWLAPRDSLMPGLHRDTNGRNKAQFEYLRIEIINDQLIYFASPAGKKTTAFYLSEFSQTHIVFENTQHDFPQRITYRLAEKDQLHVLVEGNGRMIEWRWYRAGFKPL
jgi:hypothetical protein